MLKNIYAPLSGGVAQEKLLEILANNMANANTTGYKEDKISFSAMLANPWPNYPNALPPAQFKTDMQDLYPLHGNEMEYSAIANVEADWSQGSLRNTGNPLDVALQGNGMFAVSTPFGDRYTRDGSFTLSPEGVLMTKGGALVQGENGTIAGLNEGDVRITANGEVFSGEKFIDKLKVVSVADNTLLQRLGANLYVHDGPPENMQKFQGQVSQGYLESSNVNPMKNLTSMIVAHRTYEALQKAVKAHDETMQMANNKVGEVQ